MDDTQGTGKKKKIMLISVIVFILVILIAGLIWYFVSKEKEDILRLNQFYETLKAKDSYGFTTTLDDNNKMYYATKDKKAYINTVYNGTESEFIIRDGNSYLIMDDVKSYYMYNNNETDLNKIEEELKNIKDLEHKNGKEKIENKTYLYEEYEVLTTFTMMDTSEIKENEEVKTRFYFNGDKLEYIKTIIGEKQEVLKIDVSYNIDNKLFEIPSNYSEM